MTHFHVAALVVRSDGAGGRFFTSRQVEIDYATAAEAAEVVVQLLERQQGPVPAERRPAYVAQYAGRPGLSTDPCTVDLNGEYYTVLECQAAGEACIETANTWMREKIALRKALGIW